MTGYVNERRTNGLMGLFRLRFGGIGKPVRRDAVARPAHRFIAIVFQYFS